MDPARAAFVAFALVVALALPGAAGAATITVNTEAESGATVAECGLKDAISAANTGAPSQGCPGGDPSPAVDVIDFAPTVHAISVTTPLPVLASDLSIAGPDATTIAPQLSIQATAGCACTVINQAAGVASISGLEITGGRSFGSAGGVIVAPGATMHLDLVGVEGNQATTAPTLSICGGGITNNGTLALTRSTVAQNSATSGTGGVNAGAYGGGVCSEGPFTADQDTFNGNTATASGGSSTNGAGGGGVFGFGPVSIERSTFSNNHAMASGASPAATGGGLLLNFNTGNSPLTSLTFANNDAASGPSLYVEQGATATIRNSILALPNDSGTAGAVNCATDPVDAHVVSQGFNIDSGSSCGLAAAGDQHDVLPLLSALGDYGGPTKMRGLQDGSPAIDTGNSFGEATDQRGAGFPRPSDVATAANGPGDEADIGAFEAAGTPILPPSGDQPPVQPPPPPPAGRTGRRAVALKKCKKKHSKKKRKKCKKRARKLPL